ncbi:hypothetical protein GN956_G5312 [Arapaima gigas]
MTSLFLTEDRERGKTSGRTLHPLVRANGKRSLFHQSKATFLLLAPLLPTVGLVLHLVHVIFRGRRWQMRLITLSQ